MSTRGLVSAGSRSRRGLLGITALWSALIVLLLCIGVVVGGAGAAAAKQNASAAAAVPAGFQDSLVTSVPQPTALQFTPDGRMLIAEKTGKLWVYQNGTPLPAVALDLTAKICSNSERGLLGIAVHPNFVSNRWIYLYYTFNKSGNCEDRGGIGAVSHVSRFTLPDTNVIDPNSEQLYIETLPSWGFNHVAGDLAFGKDGLLYITVGDGGCHYLGGNRCGGDNDASRDKHVLLGKVLRITDDGEIPAGNPWQGADSARCNLTGRTDPGKRCQETFAWGLRNPYRFAFDPNAAVTRFYINDVGQNHWEEIDRGEVGADYGWNFREGPCVTGSYTDCGPPPPGLTNPIFSYPQTTGCQSVGGGAFVPHGVWPASYDGAYIYGDYVCGKIFILSPSMTSTEFTLASHPVHLTFGPHAGGQALYYASFHNGKIRRIAYVGAANRNPDANLSASPTSGPVPLTVDFDARMSSDPDNDPLTYSWTFGDGGTAPSDATTSHTYTTAGAYTAQVTVRDGRGGVDTAGLRIDAGNRAPVPTIETPTPTKVFRVGETITLRGSATDPDQGTLPDSALKWTVNLHHETHIHPFLGPKVGNDIPLIAPSPEDLSAAATSYLEIRLTATDSQGLESTVTQRLDARRVNLRFDTQPAGHELQVGELTITAPATIISWDGYQFRANAPIQADVAGDVQAFSSWSDGGAASHTITTPATATTYTASFRAALGEVFSDDFETGDLSRWAWPQGLVVQQEHVFAGDDAARASTTGGRSFAGHFLRVPRSDVFYRFRFKLIRRSPSSPAPLARVRAESNATIATILVRDNGVLGVRNDRASTTRNGPSVSLGVWHSVTLRVRVATGGGEVEVWYDGARVPALSGPENLGSAPSRRIRLGDEDQGHNFDSAFDSVLID